VNGGRQAGDDPASPAAALLYLMAGPLLWGVHLLVVYGMQSALCAYRLTGIAQLDPLLVRALVVAVTVLVALALGFAAWRPRTTARLLRAAVFLDGENGPFMTAVMRLLVLLSLAGVLWAGAGALLLEACPQLR
jgi:hypothetical protein